MNSIDLQRIVEEELVNGVAKASAIGGWAAMMDPFTGEILASSQTKNYSQNKLFEAREPGSIIKPIHYSVCLKANEELIKQGKSPVFNPDEWIPSSNGAFPGRGAALKDGRVHKFLNLNVAMQKSSNIYAAQCTQKVIDVMGSEWYRATLIELFGLSQKVLSETSKESAGYLPTPGKYLANGTSEWSIATAHVLPLGYNSLTTSLQMLRSYAIFANGGREVTPYFVLNARKSSPIFEWIYSGISAVSVVGPQYKMKELLITQLCKCPGKRVLSDSVVRKIVNAMKFVTQDGGTSKLGNVERYTEAGKSGTAEKFMNGRYSKTKNIATFIGFAPLSRPRFVLIVSLDEPVRKSTPYGWHQFGGVCAAPIFSKIASRVLHYFGVAPDDLDSKLLLESAELKAQYAKLNV